ncbi:MAG TPA: GNAT family N-acetyltransferase [Azospirillaceae bacterium]|nr:GNAT family N-acetyltransferase [Azospirillaceae bacterium]
MVVLHTPRLRLEPFHERHLDGLNVLNSDPVVMRYIGGTETLEETRAVIARVQARWAEWGYSWWTFLDRTTDEVVGAGCLQHLDRDASKPHEIGWRLRPADWGRGFATEAATAIVDFAFDTVGAPVVFAVADPANTASTRVMQRLGMTSVGLERHYDKLLAAYRLDPAEWRARRR